MEWSVLEMKVEELQRQGRKGRKRGKSGRGENVYRVKFGERQGRELRRANYSCTALSSNLND